MGNAVSCLAAAHSGSTEQRFNRAAGLVCTERMQREKLLLLVEACSGSDTGASSRFNPGTVRAKELVSASVAGMGSSIPGSVVIRFGYACIELPEHTDTEAIALLVKALNQHD